MKIFWFGFVIGAATITLLRYAYWRLFLKEFEY